VIEIKLPVHIQGILDTLTNHNYEAYIVGGCVRDLLLGLTPKDFDITTNALPEEVKELFKNDKQYDTGIIYGTVSLIRSNQIIEITTFRSEGIYLDGRRPSVVTFGNSIIDDLKRRDFTINAMAFNKVLFDPFHGLIDLANKTIKAVGFPKERFLEDSLRILRGFRFAFRYGFTIEPNTYQEMLNAIPLLVNISKERIVKELDEIIDKIPKNGSSVYPIFNYFFATKKSKPNLTLLDNLYLIKSLDAKYAAIAISYNDASWLKNLGYSKKRIYAVTNLLTKFDINSQTVQSVQKFLFNFPSSLFPDLIELNEVLYKLDLSKALKAYQEIEMNNLPFCISHLTVNGDDLKKYGYLKKEIKIMLEKLLTLIIEGNISNNKEEILKYLENNQK
jgi:tRNA nucleotidyltransferase (CCA-adding enzyme)